MLRFLFIHPLVPPTHNNAPSPSKHVHAYTLKGLKMDWTVNDGLYHCFLKWRLKCENILECELAASPRETTVQESDSLE